MEKIRYEVDPHNRLVVDEAGRKAPLSRFRKVFDGRFKVDENNVLSYHIKAPVPPDIDIPHQVKFNGKWSLTDTYDLKLTLDKWGRKTFGDKLTLQGNILDVKKNSLLFAVTTQTKKNTRSAYTLKLQGLWQADKNNRLTFRIKRKAGKHDILTFNSLWEINKNRQIIYQYKKARLIRKSKKIHTLAFKGHWDIKDKTRISYIIDRNTDSVFNFKTGIGIFKNNYIKYEVGIGLSHRPKPIRRIITLFGKWKVKKNLGLIFEVEYEDKEARAILFGAEAKLTNRNTVSFNLRNDINKDISANLELFRKSLKGDSEAFIRALKTKREFTIYAGKAWRW